MSNNKIVQRSIGLTKAIPAIISDFDIPHIFNENVKLTGISYSQTGWKSSDSWSLLLDGILLFDNIYTKELGEYKHFNEYLTIKQGQILNILYHNNSGNSKNVWFNINYLS